MATPGRGVVAGLLTWLLLSGCSKSVLGPDISGQDPSGSGISGGGQPGSSGDGGGDDSGADGAVDGVPVDCQASTREVYYDSAVFADPSACDHLTLLSSTPAYTADAAVTLNDNVGATVAVQATLDATYDGTDVSLRPLSNDLSEPSTTAHTVAFAASDIPQLTYHATDCNAVTEPYICPGTSGAFDAVTKVVASSYSLLWNYDVFDQGQYEIVSKGYLVADAGAIPTTTASTAFQVPNLGSEHTTLTGSSAIGNSNFMTASEWHQFVPAVALNNAESTSVKQVFGVVYAASNGQRNQYAGVATIDRDVSRSTLTTSWFSPSTAASRLSNAANTGTMALVSTGDDDWVALSGQDGAGGSRNLILNNFNYNAGTPALTRVDLSTLADGSYLGNVAVTPAFNDGGTMRHGVAFYGRLDPGGVDTQRLYVSKILSNPGTVTEGSYFDAGSYYDSSGGNPMSANIASVPIVADQNAVLSLVRIVEASVAGTNYFYVGWRNEGDGQVYLARVQASSTSVPTVNLINSGDEITGMNSGSVRGRASYDIAAGNDSSGNAIVGVVYAQETGMDEGCNFQAFGLSGSTLVRVGAAHSFGAADCRFVRVWYNAASGKFMSLYVDGSTSDSVFTEFAYNDAADALSPASPTLVTVTERSTLPCQVGAGWSPTWQRLGIVSIEGACNGTNHSMLFDVYKTGR